MSSRPKAWLLSAYRSDSHAQWAGWLIDNQPNFDWQRRELPGRHFRWRIRGNPLSWLDELPSENPDLIVATSMVDLATLKGLHPRIAETPTIYYFHENQFAYPRSAKQVQSIDPQMVQLYGALAADRLLFNSDFNRSTFLAGVDALLRKFPDATPNGLSARLAAKSSICPVAVESIQADQARSALTLAKARGAVIVLVAQRPSLLAHCDRVLTLRNGTARLAERRRKAELRLLDGERAETAEQATPETEPQDAPQKRAGGM